jgi:hypothetical protein
VVVIIVIAVIAVGARLQLSSRRRAHRKEWLKGSKISSAVKEPHRCACASPRRFGRKMLPDSKKQPLSTDPDLEQPPTAVTCEGPRCANAKSSDFCSFIVICQVTRTDPLPGQSTVSRGTLNDSISGSRAEARPSCRRLAVLTHLFPLLRSLFLLSSPSLTHPLYLPPAPPPFRPSVIHPLELPLAFA